MNVGIWNRGLALVVIGILSLCRSGSVACPAGYESAESLFLHAKLIVKIRTLAVSDLLVRPTESEQKRNRYLLRPPSPGKDTFKNSLATVQVVETIRGETELETFELAGGPYYSCAPEPQVHWFEPGKEYFLLLDLSPPATTKRITLRWRARLQEGDLDWKKYQEIADRIWKRSSDLHREAAPEAFKRAKDLNRSLETLSWDEIKEESPATLANLHWLRVRPGHQPGNDVISGPPPIPIDESDPFRDIGEVSDHEEIATASEDGHIDTLFRGEAESGRLFRQCLHRINRIKPEQVLQHNRTVFQLYLEKRLGMEKDQATLVANSSYFDRGLSKALFSPDQNPPEIDRLYQEPPEDSNKPPGQIEHPNPFLTLPYLMAYLCECPDVAVYRFYGFDLDEMKSKLDRKLVVKALARNPEIELDYRKLSFLLCVPHPRVTPLIEEAFQQDRYPRLDKYLSYFLEVKHASACDEVMAQFETRVEEIRADPERGSWSWTYSSLEDAAKSAEQSDAPFAPEIALKLHRWMTQLKAIQPEEKDVPE